MLNELSEYIYERDRHEFSLGDTIDMKTGLLMAALTFLAIQSGTLLDGGGLPIVQSVLQALSIVAIILGGVFSAIELWPRDYMREATPEQYEEWIAKLEEYRRAYPQEEAVEFSAVRLSSAKERVSKNGAINHAKSTYMFRAFYCTTAAFILNLATLAIRLF